MNRRRFLQALGLGGASLALPNFRFARAQDATAPKRLIVVSITHGSVYEHWSMLRTLGIDGSTPGEVSLSDLREDQFSRSLQPLHAHRDRMAVFDGMSMASAILDLPGYQHEKGWVHAWTGDWSLLNGSSLLSTSPSLDQLVGRAVARPDQVPTLDLSVYGGRPICHAGYGQQLPLEEDPRRVWERLYGLSTSNDPLIAARDSVLDYARSEYTKLEPRLSSLDRERMSAHFDLVAQLESQIRGLRESTCTAPEAPTYAENHRHLFNEHARLIGTAFGCDLTRVATLSLGYVPSAEFGWGDYLSGDAHNDFAHRIYEDPRAAEAMGDYVRHEMQEVADLVRLLESIPDVDGNSVMDNTLIVIGSELADGWHGFEKYLAITIGGSWAWRGGRYLHFPWDTTPIQMRGPLGDTGGSGLPHQHLLVEAANAMGLDTQRVGLGELEDTDGNRIRLEGGIPGLRGG